MILENTVESITCWAYKMYSVCFRARRPAAAKAASHWKRCPLVPRGVLPPPCMCPMKAYMQWLCHQMASISPQLAKMALLECLTSPLLSLAEASRQVLQSQIGICSHYISHWLPQVRGIHICVMMKSDAQSYQSWITYKLAIPNLFFASWQGSAS